MLRHDRPIVRRIALPGVVAATLLLGGAVSPVEADSFDELTWVRVSACSRVERSVGLLDLEGDCIRDHPAVGEDVAVCAGHFCPAAPGESGARIIHPSDFGPTG